MPGIDIQALLATLKGRPGGVASGGRTNPMEAMQQRVLDVSQGLNPVEPAEPELGTSLDLAGLQGFQDSRGPVGIFSRGSNMYPGGGPAQQGGGAQYGAPVGSMMGSDVGADPMSSMMPPRNAILRRIQAQRGNHGLLA